MSRIQGEPRRAWCCSCLGWVETQWADYGPHNGQEHCWQEECSCCEAGADDLLEYEQGE